MRQALGASRRHVVSEVLVETTLLTLAGGLLGLAVGARRHPPARRARAPSTCRWAPASPSTRASALVGARRRDRPRASRSRVPDRLVSACASQRARRAAVGVARRHAEPRRPAPAPRLHRGADRPGVRAARGRGPARPQPRTGDGAVARLPARQHPDRPDLAAVEELSGRARRASPSPSGSLGRARAPAGRAGRGRRHQRAAQRQQQQERGHGRRATCCRPGESLRGHYSYGVGGDYFARARASRCARDASSTAADSRRAGARLRRRRGLRAPLLAGGRRASASGCSRASQAGTDAEAFTIVGVVGAVKQAELTEDEAQGAVYYPVRPPARQRRLLRRRAHQPAARVARRPRCGASCARSIPSCRSATSGRWRRASPTAWWPAARRRCWRASSPRIAAAAHRHRHVRRAELRRRPAPPRDRPAHGAGRAARRRCARQFVSLALRLLAARHDARRPRRVAHRPGACRRSSSRCRALHVATLAGARPRSWALVSLAACLLPSHRAARISPMEALAEE